VGLKLLGEGPVEGGQVDRAIEGLNDADE